jgi:hypothetical protein
VKTKDVLRNLTLAIPVLVDLELFALQTDMAMLFAGVNLV